MYIKVKLKSD